MEIVFTDIWQNSGKRLIYGSDNMNLTEFRNPANINIDFRMPVRRPGSGKVSKKFIVILAVITIIVAALLYYVWLPPVNLKSMGFYIYSLQEDKDDINLPLTKEQIITNREILCNHYSSSKLIERIKVMNNIICNL